jgi:hypothetical protein
LAPSFLGHQGSGLSPHARDGLQSEWPETGVIHASLLSLKQDVSVRMGNRTYEGVMALVIGNRKVLPVSLIQI